MRLEHNEIVKHLPTGQYYEVDFVKRDTVYCWRNGELIALDIGELQTETNEAKIAMVLVLHAAERNEYLDDNELEACQIISNFIEQGRLFSYMDKQ